MHSILLQNLQALKDTCRKHHVKRLFAFGSVCTDRFNSGSDVDLLAVFDDLPALEYGETYFSLLESVRQIFKRDVDIVTEKSLSNPYFIESIDENKVLIYGT